MIVARAARTRLRSQDSGDALLCSSFEEFGNYVTAHTVGIAPRVGVMYFHIDMPHKH